MKRELSGRYPALLRDYIYRKSQEMLHPAEGPLKHPFLTPGSEFDAEAAGENGYMALRSFPQTDAEVLAQIPNGTAVTVLGDFNGWYTVRAGDLYGFASIAEVQLGVMPLGE